jgi:cell division protein YceG involved in septum cleavage
VPKERALVAAVIANRLERDLPLGIDASLRYGLSSTATRAASGPPLTSGAVLRAGLRPTGAGPRR